jgi:ribosomal protein S18 acetylase RimI-like enzyme
MNQSETVINITRAIKADRAQLAGVAGEIFYETFKDTMPLADLELYVEDAFNVKQVRQEIEDERNIFLLAFQQDHLLGYAKLNTSRPPDPLANQQVIEIERLYVLKAHHGKKIGSLLMEKAMEIATEKFNKVIWLAVWEKNPNAIAFYKKWGFEVFGSQIFMRGNDPQTGLLMKKDLY